MWNLLFWYVLLAFWPRACAHLPRAEVGLGNTGLRADHEHALGDDFAGERPRTLDNEDLYGLPGLVELARRAFTSVLGSTETDSEPRAVEVEAEASGSATPSSGDTKGADTKPGISEGDGKGSKDAGTTRAGQLKTESATLDPKGGDGKRSADIRAKEAAEHWREKREKHLEARAKSRQYRHIHEVDFTRFWTRDFLKWWGMVFMTVPIVVLFRCVVGSQRDVKNQRSYWNDFDEPAGGHDDDETTPLMAQDSRLRNDGDDLGRAVVATDGGLGRVGALYPKHEWQLLRWFFFFVGLGCIFVNFYLLLWVNAVFLQNYVAYERGTPMDDLSPKVQEYLMAMNFRHLLNIHLAALIALTDMLGLSTLLASVVYNLLMFLWHKNRHPFDAFWALANLFDNERTLECFSTMFLVGVVHPAHMSRRFNRHMAEHTVGKGMLAQVIQAFLFVVTRVFCAFLGLVAFGVKLTLVSVQMSSPFLGWYMKVFLLCSLLCQTMGAVIVDQMLKHELLCAVFSVDEVGFKNVTMEVYQALVFQRLWQEYWEKGRRMHFVVLAVTFDYNDLRSLVFEELREVDKQYSKEANSPPGLFSPSDLVPRLALAHVGFLTPRTPRSHTSNSV